METTKKQGFASLSPEKRRELARKGGHATSINREHMAIIGRKGGETANANKRARKEALDMGAGPTDNL